jgi:hypothetical protein
MVAARKNWLRDGVPEGRGADPGRPRGEGSRSMILTTFQGTSLICLQKYFAFGRQPNILPNISAVLADLDLGADAEEKEEGLRLFPVEVAEVRAGACAFLLNPAGGR